MASIFNRTPRRKLKQSYFNLSHDHKLSFNMGKLIPVNTIEVLPGDMIRQNSDVMIKFSPLISPVMHDVNVKLYSFFIPYRILWDNWETFIAGSKSGADTGLLTPAFYKEGNASSGRTNIANNSLVAGDLGIGSLLDFMGIPPYAGKETNIWNINGDFRINALPFRAYSRVVNEYFINESVQPEITQYTNDDVAPIESQQLLRLANINWEKDYFTAALPWPQRGPTVQIPGTLANAAPVVRDSTKSGPTFATRASGNQNAQFVGGQIGAQYLSDTSGAPVNWNDPALVVGASGLTDGTMDNLRTAMKVKLWLETAARSGARYTEHLLGHWGTHNRDSRLQRPEFLAGSQTPVIFSDVMQTSSTDSVSPQGNYSGHGMTVSLNHKFSRRFTEDGCILTLMAVVPKTAYCDGIPRMYLRNDRFDYPFPEFAHLSEQPIQNQEIYAPWLPGGGTGTARNTFGYIPRYAEMRYIPSRISGDFRSTLNHWHLGRQFVDYTTWTGNPPGLNNAFVTSNPSTRIFAVEQDQSSSLYCQVRNNIMARRSLPKFAIPTW